MCFGYVHAVKYPEVSHEMRTGERQFDPWPNLKSIARYFIQ